MTEVVTRRRTENALSRWDVSPVTAFEAMFYANFDFDQDITSWDVATGASLSLEPCSLVALLSTKTSAVGTLALLWI